MRNEFATTPLAKQKHAEFMLKLAEKIFGIVIVGALGVPAMHWLTFKQTQSDWAYRYYLILIIAGVIAAFILLNRAIKIYNSLKEEPAKQYHPGENK